jgi:hypothetical protein
MKRAVICLFLLICQIFVNYAEIQSTQSLLEHPIATDYFARGDRKAHKFGVELRANTQFHHTKTDEDGVRMGCYGHVENGKMVSTYYVADARGYRLVPNQDLVPVYPEIDTERKASFVKDFDVDEKNSQNIRYFFPNACNGPELPELGELPEITRPSTTQRTTIPIQRSPDNTTSTATTTTTEPPPIPIVPNDLDTNASDTSFTENKGLRNNGNPRNNLNELPGARNGNGSCRRTTHLRFPEYNKNGECCSYENFASLVVPIPLDKFTQRDVDAVTGLDGDDLLLKVLEIFKRD